jgi:two-component system, OmpR family, response regulator PrrA
MSTQVLLVEDEPDLGFQIEQVLNDEGFEVRWCKSLVQAKVAVNAAPPAITLLDLNLPDGDGLELLSLLRKAAPNSRNIVLTARTSPHERIEGLNLGADDYISKPFVLAELLARIRAHMRRHDEVADRDVVIGPLSVQMQAKTARIDGQILNLAPREMDMLILLARSSPAPVSRDTFALALWDTTNRTFVTDNVMDVHVARLRRKLELPGLPRLLHTVRGVGFVLGLSEK